MKDPWVYWLQLLLKSPVVDIQLLSAYMVDICVVGEAIQLAKAGLSVGGSTQFFPVICYGRLLS